MVNHMGTPEPADTVAGTVEPVVAKLHAHIQRGKSPGRDVDGQQSPVVNPLHGGQHQTDHDDDVQQGVNAPQVHAVQAVAQGVYGFGRAFVLLAKAQPFDEGGDKKEGGQQDQQPVPHVGAADPVVGELVKVSKIQHDVILRAAAFFGLMFSVRFLTYGASMSVGASLVARIRRLNRCRHDLPSL